MEKKIGFFKAILKLVIKKKKKIDN